MMMNWRSEIVHEWNYVFLREIAFANVNIQPHTFECARAREEYVQREAEAEGETEREKSSIAKSARVQQISTNYLSVSLRYV